jgi:hypothetical protein
MPRLTDKQRAAALAADVAAHKERSARRLQEYLRANENHNGRAVYIVADEAHARSFDRALIDTRCPDLHAWFNGNARDAKSAQALLNKTDYKKRALAPEALDGYREMLVEYVGVLKQLNAMKNAKQTALV